MPALARHTNAGRELLDSDRLLASSPDLVETARRPLTNALIELYEAWDAVAPDQGYDAKTAAWGAKLPATQPATTQP